MSSPPRAEVEAAIRTIIRKSSQRHVLNRAAPGFNSGRVYENHASAMLFETMLRGWQQDIPVLRDPLQIIVTTGIHLHTITPTAPAAVRRVSLNDLNLTMSFELASSKVPFTL